MPRPRSTWSLTRSAGPATSGPRTRASSRTSIRRGTISIAGLKNVEVGYPQFFWEGASEYGDALGRNIQKAIAGQLTSQQALDEAAEEWVQIVQKLGIDSQMSQYANFVKGARSLGYKI